MNFALAREGASEDRVEDGSQVESINWRCIRRGNDGSRLRELVLVLAERTASCQYQMLKGQVNKANPFFTPSTPRSIHQMPGTPSIHQSIAFLPREPIGSHETSKK